MPERWLARVERAGHGLLPFEPLDAPMQLAESVMMGLRLAEGVPLARLRALTGGDWQAGFDPAGLARALAAGRLTVTGDRLVATPAGRLLLDAVLVDLLP